jgi:hypothetical protein
MSRSGATTDPTRLAPPDPARHHNLHERVPAVVSRADIDADLTRGRALSPLGFGESGAGAGARGAEPHAVRRSGGGRRRAKKRAAPIRWKKLLWVRQSCEHRVFWSRDC